MFKYRFRVICIGRYFDYDCLINEYAKSLEEAEQQIRDGAPNEAVTSFELISITK